MPLKSYLPTVLLVDDDSRATQFWRSHFQAQESVGVVEANSMLEAKLLLDDPSIEFDAVVADLFFEHNTDAPEFSLFTGVDLLGYSQERRPDVLRYTLSFCVENPGYKHQADERGISVRQWFPKSIYSPDAAGSPWEVIAKDLLDAHLEQRHLHSSEESINVVSHMSFPMRTYLQSLDDQEFVITRPIEVICRQDCIDGDHLYFASAQRLGLLQDGEGASIDAALTHLGDLIVAQQQIFEEEPEVSFVGLAGLVKKRFSEHIARRS